MKQISMEIEPKLETDVDLENSPGSRPISDKELKESFARVTEVLVSSQYHRCILADL